MLAFPVLTLRFRHREGFLMLGLICCRNVLDRDRGGGAVSLESREPASPASSIATVSKRGHAWTGVLCCRGLGLWTSSLKLSLARL